MIQFNKFISITKFIFFYLIVYICLHFNTVFASVNMAEKRQLKGRINSRVQVLSQASLNNNTIKNSKNKRIALNNLVDNSVNHNKLLENNINLNFQEIEIRVLLHLFSRHLKKNVIISENVVGNMSLNLNNVSWKIAFDFILENQGLAYREFNNIIYIAKSEELLANEKILQEYQLLKQETKNLEIDFLQVNYASGENLVSLLINNDDFLLSKRGKVLFDKRTNVIIILDFKEKIGSIKKFIKRLDVPQRQVLIETQIVKVTDDFRKAFGIKFGASHFINNQSRSFAISPSVNNSKQVMSKSSGNSSDSDKNKDTQRKNQSSPFSFDFNLGEINTALGFSMARLPQGLLLDLELQALEKENKATIYAKPKLLTLDKQTAIIESGKDIPYITKSRNSTDPYVIFKKAALRLEVTPFVNPKGKVLLKLKINKDQPGIQVPGIAQAPIDTTQIATQILANDGETIVLGGIFSKRKIKMLQKVPLLGDLPIIGNIFKARHIIKDKSEILIFVTPRLLS